VATSRRTLLAAAGATAATVTVSTMASAGTNPSGTSLATAAQATPEATASDLPATPPEFDALANWPNEGGDLQHTRHMRETTISTETVGSLGLEWFAPIDTTGGYGALVAPAMIVGDVVYQQDSMSNVWALDKASGAVLWTKTYNEAIPSGGPNGIAIAYGKAYFSVGAGVLHAIDATTGDELWQNDLVGPLREGICMTPLVYDGVVYVSTVPGSPDGFYQPGQRGVFYAVDAETGATIWYWETTEDNLWGQPRVNSGGGLWHPPSVDERGSVYLAVANAAPYPGTEEWPNGSSRPGNNPWTNHLVSLDTATAEMNWAFSVTERDIFDLDNHLSPVPLTIEVEGVERNLVLTAGKHGYIVAAFAETGDEYWRHAVGRHQNDHLDEVPDGEEIEIFPGTQGGVQTSMGYANGVVYLPIVNSPSYATPSSIVSGQKALPEATGQLVAIDVATGAILWDIETASPLYGGASIAGDVVFTAGLDGVVRGYNTADGSQVFSYQTTAGINSPLSLSGDYLFVSAGTIFFPSADSTDPLPERVPGVFALKLGGTAQLPTPAASPTA
jgi:outer membrane protein assembly factor BamB